MKTKIKLLSDLHIEGFPFQYEDHDEDVVVLAGDIHTRNRLHELLDQIPRHKDVIFVAGNHEYYHMVFEDVKRYFRDLEAKYSNFTFLDNERADVYGIPVYGGTMFTDFQLTGAADAFFAEHCARDGINDFHAIKCNGEHYEPREWRTADHVREFTKYVDGLNAFLLHTEGAPFRIVISHFMPTEQCTAPQFVGSVLNPYFTANMERYMGWDGLWIAGHGHNPVDVMVGGTRVVMNPRGYRARHLTENHVFNPGLVIEV